MKLKRFFRFLTKSFALVFFICDIYVVAYAQASFQGPLPREIYGMVCFFTLLMGILIMITGVLTEYDERNPKLRRSTILSGLFFSLGAILVFFALFLHPV